MPPRRELLPAQSSQDYLEGLLASRVRRSRAVYLAVLALVAAGAVALPLVRVPVTVRARGSIRPVLEKQEIAAPVAGVVDRVAIRANAAVHAGDTLLVLRAEEVAERMRTQALRLHDALARAADLERLLTVPGEPPSAAELRTRRYAEEASQARRRAEADGDEVRHAERELARARSLAALGLAPASEVEQRQAELERRRAEADEAEASTRARWRAELAEARREARDAEERAGQIAEERSLYVVRAPVAGTVEEAASLAPGSYLRAGETIAVLSPAAALLAEVLVLPRDVGLLRRGTPARLQIDAFRHTQWGVLTGRILDLPADFTLADQQPVYRVPVSLDRTSLALRNGYRGELRKGMTLTARFVVARRSLLQLLRDDVADWLDPRGDGAGPAAGG